jgi:hypothetical protein
MFSGFLGANTTAHAHPVRLCVADWELSCELFFSTQPLPRGVLGRDLLDAFVLGIREH